LCEAAAFAEPLTFDGLAAGFETGLRTGLAAFEASLTTRFAGFAGEGFFDLAAGLAGLALAIKFWEEITTLGDAGKI
jgi:hypothetical protein